MRRAFASLTASVAMLLAASSCGRSHDQVAHAAADVAPPPLGAPKAPEIVHAVFSLGDNRLLAHETRGAGLVVPCGTAAFDKYLNFGAPNMPWRRHQNLDGRRVAVVTDSYPHLIVPITDENAKSATAIWARMSGDRSRPIELFIAGKKVAQVQAAAGWQTLKIPLPPGSLPAGEHEIQLVSETHGDAESVEWLQIGGDDPTTDRLPAVWDLDRQALVLAGGDGLAYYLAIPELGRLRADVIGDGCKVAVHAAADGKIVDGTLAGAKSDLDLGALAGKIARVELRADGCAQAELAGAALVVPGDEAKIARGPKPKHIVFWIMDSLRADRVRPFAPDARPETPNWERLAREGTLFMQTYVQGNESKQSHSSIWTSQYVANHMVIDENAHLPDRWVTLGEAMKKAGYFTAGISANGWIAERWGFGNGWDYFHNHIQDEDAGVLGEMVWADAKGAVSTRVADPFFIYLGMVDTHVPWRIHEPWFSKLDSEPYDGQFKTMMDDDEEDAVIAGKMPITDREKSRIQAFYDSDVSYQDDLIGKVREQLDAWGIGGDTMIVVMADHGDELWENGLLGHGGSLHEALVHVPLAILYPPLFPPGVRVDEGVEAVDILPTLEDAAGMPPNPDQQGESLIPLAQGVGRGYPRPSFSSMYEDSHTMRIGKFKLIVGSAGGAHLYDELNDKLERTDLSETRPVEMRFMTDAMSLFMLHQKEWKKSRWGVASNQKGQIALDLDK